VPNEAILIDTKSTNTGENILFAKKIIEDSKIEVKTVILTTQPQLLCRAYATFKCKWPEAHVFVSAINTSWVNFPNLRISLHELRCVMVGEVKRLTDYVERGFIVPTTIEEVILTAANQLSKQYNKYL